jgi:hypothetical protein
MNKGMKTNEAPEKIYLTSNENGTHYYTESQPFERKYVEYIRTDAFIEKAEKFFTEKFEVEDYNDNIDIDGSPIFNYGRFIDDFKKYMKGE